MKYEDKRDEARFFLELMEKCVGRPEARFFLSAFLSAARSVIQYVYEEAKTQGRVPNYDELIAGNEVVQFFKCQRDINIHNHLVGRTISVHIPESVYVGAPVEPTEEQDPVIHYRFSDWKGDGDGDIVELSKRYLNEIDIVLQKARAKGLIGDTSIGDCTG